ncbi:MAG: sulfide-dependent adenosine diphosphate thiazole synthase [Anaerolineae bacterium]|nr:sulfide-dependent adenosine diphosphate thiazole synthase [Anaerolineae bacterium]
MAIDDIQITEHIFQSYFNDLLAAVRSDVLIIGAGPAGLTAAWHLAQDGYQVVVLERGLAVGGGMWGGGTMFSRIVVYGEEAKDLLAKAGVRVTARGDGYYVADAVECVAALTLAAAHAGAQIFNCIAVEDLLVRHDRVEGVVVQWMPVLRSGLHVDPVTFQARAVVDATGHGAELVRLLAKRRIPLPTPGGEPQTEGPMWAEVGERKVVELTGELYPGLFVAGMAAAAVFGAPRMGPIFGGMLLSGKRVAEQIGEALSR